jgi:hypothetical protein
VTEGGLQLFQVRPAAASSDSSALISCRRPSRALIWAFGFPAALGSSHAGKSQTLQAEDAAEDALAVAGTLLGELVGLALQEEGGIDKGLVIQAQGRWMRASVSRRVRSVSGFQVSPGEARKGGAVPPLGTSLKDVKLEQRGLVTQA